mmetsp:Transcript_11353/g.15282  ORF Transcript_11353/g.15282 Transcript_11353/m.15282 type:complete len:367 (+) Transcript_11353:112-1212(+)
MAPSSSSSSSSNDETSSMSSDSSTTSSSSSSPGSTFSLFSILTQFRLKPSDIYMKLMRKAAEATGKNGDETFVISDEHVNLVADKAAEYILGGNSDDVDIDPDGKDSSHSSFDRTALGNAAVSDNDNRNKLRNVGIYKTALDAIKYQRDGYIMGAEYAAKNAEYRHCLRGREEEMIHMKEEKENERGVSAIANRWEEGKDDVGSLLPAMVNRENATASSLVQSIAPLLQDTQTMNQQLATKIPLISPPDPILDPQTSFGKTQLVDLGKWFIPSPTVYDALKPTVLWLSGSDGPLYQPALQSILSTIQLSQDNLNWVMKNNIMWYLQDDAFRARAKGMTRGYIHDGSNSGGKYTNEEETNGAEEKSY